MSSENFQTNRLDFIKNLLRVGNASGALGTARGMSSGETRDVALRLIADAFLKIHAHKSVFDAAALMSVGEDKDAILDRAIASCVTDGTLEDLLEAAKLRGRALTENELETFATGRAASDSPECAFAPAALMQEGAARSRVLECALETSVKKGLLSTANRSAELLKRSLVEKELLTLVRVCLQSGNRDHALAAADALPDGEAKWNALTSVAAANAPVLHPLPLVSLETARMIAGRIHEGLARDGAYKQIALAYLEKIRRLRALGKDIAKPDASATDEALKLVAATYFKHNNPDAALIYIDLLAAELAPGEFEQLVSRV
jgi:hypothetical protein